MGHMEDICESRSRSPETPRLLTIPDAKSLLLPGTLTQFAPSSKGAEQGFVSQTQTQTHNVRAFNKSGKKAPHLTRSGCGLFIFLIFIRGGI